ncbi:MAG: nucleotidyltransferase family protein [Anaerolineae bacterium]
MRTVTKKPAGYRQVSISTATRRLLCDFAAGDAKRPLRRADVNWEAAFRRICRDGLLGLTYRYLSRGETRDYPPEEFRQHIQIAYHASLIRLTYLYHNLGYVLAHLKTHGLECLVIKGPAVACTVYPHPTLRFFTDLDLVVRERDLVAAHRLLVEIGFNPQQDQPPPPAKLVPQAVLHHLSYLQPQTGLMVEVHYDDLLNAGLVSRDLDGFWMRARRIAIENVPVKVLSPEDQLIHLCAHAHAHGYSRLNWFSDLAFILRERAGQLDWDHVIETLHLEEAQVSGYYTLYFLERLLGVAAPRGVLDALRPDRFRRWWHTRLLPEAQVLSLQPTGLAFGLHVIPLFRQLLPDVLIMGRRRDKLPFLFRLLLPPATWLKYYYRLDNPLQIPLYYLLHPLKLVYHYLAEVVPILARIRQWYRHKRPHRSPV